MRRLRRRTGAAPRPARPAPLRASRALAAALAVSAAAAGMARPACAQRPASDVSAAVHEYVAGHRGEIVGELVRLLAIPNVAADSADIRRNAALIRAMMERRGVATRLIETGGAPAIYGALEVPGATRTMLIYAHYDGQPVDSSRWIGTTPFHPVLRAGTLARAPALLPWPHDGGYEAEWRVYARSASDDKAPIVAMLRALDALKDAGSRPAVNLKFLFEGEEEAGSPHLEEALRRNAALLKADVALVADGPVYPSNAPTVTFGARGIVTAQVTVYGATRPLHSGHYGNWAPNPAERLAALLASMQDSTGCVTIAGWYDDVVAAGPAERAAFAALARMPAEARERRDLGIAQPEGDGRSRWEMVMQPSLNVDGIRSGWVGSEARTIIPAEATASLDLRLVPDVQPEDQLRRLVDHIRRQGYDVVEEEPDSSTRLAHARIARVTASRGYPAVRTALDAADARAIIAALRGAAGDDLVVIPTMGGSVPGFVFPKYLGATFVGLPIVNPDNDQHSPNENLRLGNLFRGVELFAAAVRARLPAPPSS